MTTKTFYYILRILQFLQNTHNQISIKYAETNTLYLIQSPVASITEIPLPLSLSLIFMKQLCSFNILSCLSPYVCHAFFILNKCNTYSVFCYFWTPLVVSIFFTLLLSQFLCITSFTFCSLSCCLYFLNLIRSTGFYQSFPY